MHDKTTPFVNFAIVKERIGIVQVLDHYGITWLKSKGDELQGKCPLHEGEGDRTFHINIFKNNFQCFSCKAKGNVLDFVALKENCSVKQAAYLLATTFRLAEALQTEQSGELATVAKTEKSSQTKAKSQKIITPPSIINPSLSFQLRIDPKHKYGFDRGLTGETVNHFGCGLCLSKGMFGGRYVFPLHDGGGQLVGYAGRSLRDDVDPKYLFPSSEKHFYKSHLLFGLHQLITAGINPDQPVVIVEGFFGAAKVLQADFSCVALFGSSLSEQQQHLIVQHFNRVILLFDGDAAGRQCTEDALRRLSRQVFVHAVDLSDGEQPDNLEIDEIKMRLFAL